MAKKVSFCHSRLRLYFAYIIMLSQHTWTFLAYISLICRLYFAYIIILSQHTWTFLDYISLIFREYYHFITADLDLYFAYILHNFAYILHNFAYIIIYHVGKKQKHAYISLLFRLYSAYIFRLYYYVGNKNSLILSFCHSSAGQI